MTEHDSAALPPATRVPTPTTDQIAQFRADGAVMVPGVVDPERIRRLHAATERMMAAPGHYAKDYGKPGQQGRFFGDLFMWRRDPDFRAMVFDAGLAAFAAAFLAATRIRFYFDHLLVKEPGSEAPTPWHQDTSYFCVDGEQMCSTWLALDPIDTASGRLQLVRGSHRWDRTFQPADWADYHQQGRTYNPDLDAAPDIEANRGAFDILAWDMAPGDCIVFHARMMHGAAGNAAISRRRRALSLRWLGDDVTYLDRKGSIKPWPHPHLADGAEPADPGLPLVWTREG